MKLKDCKEGRNRKREGLKVKKVREMKEERDK